MSVAIFNGPYAKILASAGIKLKDDTLILHGVGVPAVTAPNGSVFLSTLGLYSRVNGAWTKLDAPELDIAYLDVETWTKTALTDTSITNIGCTLDGTSQVNGSNSVRAIHQAATTYSVKKTISVSPKFRGRNITLSLWGKSTALSGNVTILFRDETNATDIGVSQQVSLDSSISNKVFSFNIPANCSNLSYKISFLQEAGSPNTYVDDILLSLTQFAKTSTSISQTTFNATAWAPYTPVFTGFGTATSIEFEYRQIAENYEIRGKFVAGTTTAVEARVSLPLSAISAGTGSIPSISDVGHYVASSSNGFSGAILIEPTTAYITLGQPAAGGTFAALTKVLANALLSSGTAISFFASIPIAGLTTSTTTSTTIPLTTSVLVQQPDSVLVITAQKQMATTNTKVLCYEPTAILQNLGSAIKYESDTVLGDRFTALVAGTYNISASIAYINTSSGIMITLNQTDFTSDTNSLNKNQFIAEAYSSVSTTNFDTTASATVFLNVGDVIRVAQPFGPFAIIAGAARAKFSMSLVGSIKILNPSSDQKIDIPTHSLRFEGASTRGSTDTAIVKFDTQAITQGDAWDVVNTAANGTVITMKKAGKLSVSTSLRPSDAGSSIQITKNQQTKTAISAVASEIMANSYIGIAARPHASSTFDVNIGDVIRVTAESSPTANVGNMVNLSLTENNIPANFSNVLPQWSQSDSSIRLNTVNGYGSTNTVIRRFSNTVDNLGTAITYTDSASLGASFIANESGIYTVTYADVFNSGSYFGLSKNSSQLMTDIRSINVADRLEIATSSASDFVQTVSWSGYLLKGDIVRPHTQGSASGTNPDRAQFTISKVGKPNLSSVDVTSFVNMKITDTQYFEHLATTSTFGSTLTNNAILSTPSKNTNTGIFRVSTDSVNGTQFTILKKCLLTMRADALYNQSNQGLNFYRNTTISLTNIFTNQAVTARMNSSINVEAEVGEVYSLGRGGVNALDLYNVQVTATADNNATASPTQQVSSDTMSFAFKATAIDPAVDAVGTFNTYTYAASTNTATISASAPTQSTSSMNANGVQVFARAYNAASTAASPARVDVFIGKGLKSKQVDAFESLAKVSPATFDLISLTAALTVLAGTQYSYSELTGILTITAGLDGSGVSTTRYIGTSTSTASGPTSGYFVFNASKSPSLVTIPNLAPRIAYLSDVKASGTTAGSLTTGIWNTRVLNTITDDTGIIGSLSANTFTLKAGTYDIFASAPAYQVERCKLRLYNIADGSISLMGQVGYISGSSGYSQTSPTIIGSITITSDKSFRLEHYIASATDALNAGGVSTNVAENNEVYSQVKITKIK